VTKNLGIAGVGTDVEIQPDKQFVLWSATWNMVLPVWSTELAASANCSI